MYTNKKVAVDIFAMDNLCAWDGDICNFVEFGDAPRCMLFAGTILETEEDNRGIENIKRCNACLEGEIK